MFYLEQDSTFKEREGSQVPRPEIKVEREFRSQYRMATHRCKEGQGLQGMRNWDGVVRKDYNWTYRCALPRKFV